MDDEIQTPALKRLEEARKIPLSQGFQGVNVELVRGIANSVAKMAPTVEEQQFCLDITERALKEIECIMLKDEELGRIALEAAFNFSFAGLRVLLSTTNKEHEQQAARMQPLARKQAAKSMVIDRAQSIAKERWKLDTNQKIRIGEMAELVWAELAKEGLADLRPENTQQIRNWIKPAAPDYARKGGKPRKSSFT